MSSVIKQHRHASEATNAVILLLFSCFFRKHAAGKLWKSDWAVATRLPAASAIAARCSHAISSKLSQKPISLCIASQYKEQTKSGDAVPHKRARGTVNGDGQRDGGRGGCSNGKKDDMGIEPEGLLTVLQQEQQVQLVAKMQLPSL